MQDQITELTARLAKATTKEELKSVDMAVYHLRKDRKAQLDLTLNLLLAQIATLKELQDADDERLHALADQVEAKMEPFDSVEGAV